MHTKNLSTFTKMVNIAKNENLEYKILYSYHQRNATNGLTEVYKLILCTHLFTITYEENIHPDNTNAINDFIKYNNSSCIKLDFDVKFNSNDCIELK